MDGFASPQLADVSPSRCAAREGNSAPASADIRSTLTQLGLAQYAPRFEEQQVRQLLMID